VLIWCCSTFLLIGECVLLSCVTFSFFPYQAKRMAWEKRLQNDWFCVEWDIKPQLHQSVSWEQQFAAQTCDQFSSVSLHAVNSSTGKHVLRTAVRFSSCCEQMLTSSLTVCCRLVVFLWHFCVVCFSVSVSAAFSLFGDYDMQQWFWELIVRQNHLMSDCFPDQLVRLTGYALRCYWYINAIDVIV